MTTRIYQAVELQEGNELCLNEKATHHLLHVLRAKCQDVITIFNGHGGEYQARIIQIKKKQITVLIEKWFAHHAESHTQLILGQCIARQDKMDFVIQKAVELGVNTITPLIAARSNFRDITAKRLQHWHEVAISACEQCGRTSLPNIDKPLDLITWCNNIRTQVDVCFVLTTANAGQMQLEKKNFKKIALLVGSEGGLQKDEIDYAITNGFLPLHLGPRILRTETAAIAAITIMQYNYGDLLSS